jgi:hypothetical protein
MNISAYIFSLALLVGAGFAKEPGVQLLSRSWLNINGTSNINDFAFNFSFEDYTDNVHLHVSMDKRKMVIHPFSLSLPIKKFKCSNILLKQDFRETLKYQIQPEIHINVDSLFIVNTSDLQHGALDAFVEIGGLGKSEKITYTIIKHQDEVKMQGKIKIDMATYDLEYGRKFMGLIQVDRYVDITFLFNFVVNQ